MTAAESRRASTVFTSGALSARMNPVVNFNEPSELFHKQRNAGVWAVFVPYKIGINENIRVRDTDNFYF